MGDQGDADEMMKRDLRFVLSNLLLQGKREDRVLSRRVTLWNRNRGRGERAALSPLSPSQSHVVAWPGLAWPVEWLLWGSSRHGIIDNCCQVISTSRCSKLLSIKKPGFSETCGT